MKPNDIYRLVSASSPRVSPDGQLVAFVVTRVDEAENGYRSQVWLAAVDGSTPPEPFSNGEHHDGNPCWSPDGRRLAFTSAREDKKSTLHVRPVATPGETVTLASLPESLSTLVWSPDGRWLAFSSRARTNQYDEEDVKRQPPRRITRFFSRLNDEGWITDRPRHIWVVPADGSAVARDLTPGEFEFAHPSWAPDSSRLVVDGTAHDTWDTDFASDLYVIAIQGGAPTPLTHGGGALEHPSWSPDGRRVAFLGIDNPLTYPQNAKVGVVDVDGGERRWVSTIDLHHSPFPGAIAPLWSADGAQLDVVVEDRGDVGRHTVSADGGEEVPHVHPSRTITDLDERGGTRAFTATTPTTLSELFVERDGEERRLTHFGDAFTAAVRVAPHEHFLAPSTGEAEVDTWVVLPPEFDPAGSYPALLSIHGGPFTQYRNAFFDEVQLYTAAGYVVVFCNPRGSSGRHTAWGRAIVGAKDRFDPGTGWGSVDYEDVLAAMDEAMRRYPAIDPDRQGVLGGSYGGYMTSWIIGHTDRFCAACSERAVNNLMSLEWGSDIATVFRTELGVSHLDDPTEYLARSPISYVHRIRTPVLIIHSEEDLRCPIEQAEQLFVALRLLGREVEFLRFPAESHELSRSGSPVHRVQRAEAILEFFGRHFKPDGGSPGL